MIKDEETEGTLIYYLLSNKRAGVCYLRPFSQLETGIKTVTGAISVLNFIRVYSQKED